MRTKPQIFTTLQKRHTPVTSFDIEELMIEAKDADIQKYVNIVVDDRPLRVELASSARQRTQGLMGREKIGSDGMLFTMDNEPAFFHMKNTTIPLDIVYFDSSGVALKIDEMEPTTGKSNCIELCAYVLELPKGACTKLGINAGSQLEITGGNAKDE